MPRLWARLIEQGLGRAEDRLWIFTMMEMRRALEDRITSRRHDIKLIRELLVSASPETAFSRGFVMVRKKGDPGSDSSRELLAGDRIDPRIR